MAATPELSIRSSPCKLTMIAFQRLGTWATISSIAVFQLSAGLDVELAEDLEGRLSALVL